MTSKGQQAVINAGALRDAINKKLEALENFGGVESSLYLLRPSIEDWGALNRGIDVASTRKLSSDEVNALIEGLGSENPSTSAIMEGDDVRPFQFGLTIFHCWATTMRCASSMKGLPDLRAQFFSRCCGFNAYFLLSA